MSDTGRHSARTEVLARVRAANTAGAAHIETYEIPRTYRTEGALAAGGAQVLDLLRDRLLDYRALVSATDEAGIPAAVAAALHSVTGAAVVPAGLPTGWCPDGIVDDGTLTADELDQYGAVVTCCAAACAETGTIALDGSADQGRRALTLVPDVHVCVVRANQVVETVPELLGRLDPTAPITLVSGPSATSDIELQRVEGVHGPRTLVVVLVTSATT